MITGPEYESLLKEHAGIIQNTLTWFFDRFNVHRSEHEYYRASAVSDIWLYGASRVDINTSSFIRQAVVWSCMRSCFRDTPMLGDGTEDSPEIELFIEDSEFSGKNGCNNRLACFYSIDGAVFPALPELLDLDDDDLAAIREFCASRVEDRSRRTVLRRRVDIVLNKIGIDSTEIHEYTSRDRAEGS